MTGASSSVSQGQPLHKSALYGGQPTAKLNNGQEIPLLALGTWKVSATTDAGSWKAGAGEVQTAVENAVHLGIRHIDTAEMYGNQEEIGAALERLFSEGIIKREDMWITSKLHNNNHVRMREACQETLKALCLDYLDAYLITTFGLHNKNHTRVREACQETLRALRLEYLDAYLMHWPFATDDQLNVLPGPPIEETYHHMEKLMDDGLVKSIGVSNFSVKKLRSLLAKARIKPQIHQIEGHIYFRNEYSMHYCSVHGIHVTAYSPFGSPDSASVSGRRVNIAYPLHDPMVIKIAEKHGKHPAQVLLRWEIQRGVSTAFKAVNPKHIAFNLEALHWELPPEDMRALTTIAYAMRFVDGEKWWVREDGPIKSLTDLWDGEELTGWPPGVSTYAWLSTDKL